MAFDKVAERRSAKLKLAIVGASGDGKTYSALAIAGELGKRIGLLDSEYESALKCAGRPGIPRFFHEPMGDPSIQEYLAKTDAAAAAGIDVLIYDSWTHSWTAALDAVNAMGGNKFTNGWNAITPLVRRLILKMISYPGHCIATMRLDTEWVTEETPKGKVPRKVGMKTIAGKGVEYEFDWVLRLTPDAQVIVEKTRNGDLLRKDTIFPREDLLKVIRRLVAWLDEGAPVSPCDALADRIRLVDTEEGLVALRPAIGEHLKSNPGDTEALKRAYEARKNSLSQSAEVTL